MLAKKRREGRSGELLASNCKEVQVSTPYASELSCFFPPLLQSAPLMQVKPCSWKSGGAGSTGLQER